MNTWKDEFDTDYVKYLKPTESFRGSNEIKLFIESLLKDRDNEIKKIIDKEISDLTILRDDSTLLTIVWNRYDARIDQLNEWRAKL